MSRLSNLYATLEANGINMPKDISVFEKNMEDSAYRRKLYKGLQEKGLRLKQSEDEFDAIWSKEFGESKPKSKSTTDEDRAKTFVMSPEWQEDYARGKEVENEIKAEDAKRKQIVDSYNAYAKLEDSFAKYEQSQDVAELFPGVKSESSTTWRDRVAKRKEGEAQAKAKVDQERAELRQRMQLLKDNPDAYNELYGFKGFDIDKVNLDNLFTFDPTVDKRGNKHDNVFARAFANQRIDAEDKALQLGFQQQELQDMLADPMALNKTMRDVEAEIERLGKARDVAAQKFSSENPFKAILFATKGTKSLDPWLEGAYGPEAQAITLELEKAFAKLDNLKNIEKKIKSGELPRGGFWNGVGQMGQAVADKVTDRSWGMYEGMSNMLSESEKQIVFDKIAKGEPLTASEMQWATIDLLEKKANTEVDSPYLYNITSGLMESAPYMRDIFLSPGKGISGAFVNWGKSRYGATGFLKLVGNALQGAATTATVGVDELVSGTSERMRGDLSFGENGLEVTGQKSLGRALTQQFASQTASNMVELMGVPLLDKAGKYIGKAVKEVADGLSYGKVSKVLSAMDKSSAVNWVNGVRKSMGIHSLPAEIGEEYVDGFAQSIVEGEDQLSPMLNTEEFLNIAGTCGLMSAIFGSANIAGFATEYHKVNREFKKAKQEVLRQFSSDVWASLDNLITNAQDEDLTVRLADAMDGMAMNREQRSAIMNYLTALKRYQKFNELNDGGKFIIGGPQQAQATQSTSTSTSTYEIDSDITLKDEIGNPIDAHIVGRDANGNYMVESSQPINGKRVQPMSADQLDAMVIPNTPDGIQQSEVDGYNMTDANQQAEVSMLTDNARESVATLLGVTPDAVDVTLQQALGDNPTDAKIEARFGDNAQVVKDYMYNVAKTKGMSARLIDDIADATAESDRAIDAVANNGNVVTAKDVNENDVNVISGNIATYEDGLIDTHNSDSSVVIRHADGTTEMVAPTSLTEVVSMPTEQAKAAQAQAIAQQKQQAFSDKLNGVLDYSQGQQYTMLNADGSTTDVTILADNGDGNVTVTARDGNKEGGVTDGKQIVLPKSQIQQGVREFKRNQLRGETAQQASIPQAEAQPTEVAEPTQEPSMPTDEQGNIMYEQMDADSAWDALLAETGGDADMAMTVANEMIADKTKAVEEASKMVAQPGATPQEKIANLKAVKQAQAQAQAELDAWKAIAEAPTRRMSIAEEATTESVVESTPTESESTPQVGLVEDARTRTLGDKTRKMLDAMAKRLGLQVEFVDEIVTGKDEKGRNLYANAVIVGKNVKIAWHNRNRAIDFLLGHEFTHRMQDLSPEAYAEFVEATKQALGEEEWNKRINRMRDIYKSQGKTISEQGIIDEVVADYAGELVEERGVFDNFVERNKDNRSLLSKIADVLRSIKEFFTLGKQRKIDNAIARLEALIESASEANLRGDVVNMEKDRYSVSSIFEGTGAIVFNEEGGANIDKDGNFYVIINGKQYDGNNLITLDDIKADKRSVLNLMVEDAIKEGNVTEEHADVIMKKYVDIMNMFLVEGLAENGGYANMADKWMWVGETVYKTVQPNSDKQYTKSIDITTVCKKNEAVIRAMSEMQKRVGYGITPAQILDIYIETQQSGYQVPCPVCYVFSRYLRNGKYASGAILGMEQYGEHLPGGSGETWTADQWVAELRRLEKIDEDKANKALYNQASADIVEAETLIDKLGLRLQQSNSEAERKELRKQIEKADARYRAALNIFSQSALTSWIKTFAIQGSDDKGYKMRDDAQYPEDIELFKEHALDLRKAGETQTLFPAIQRLRNSGGSSTGKAVGFESNNALGDVISGIATGNNDTAYTRASKATTEKEFQTNRKKATENFKKASEYIKQQTLRGGQRMWSWSDNIEALMPDVVINLMQLELLGGALQTYSKQLEGVNLVARMGGYVNGSLMAKDNGYTEVTEDMIKVEDGKEVLAEDVTETIQEPIVGRGIVDRTRVLAQAGSPVIEVGGKKYVLIFDDVIGIDPHGREVNGVHMKGLFDLNKELSKAGNIIVGMNDTHIRVGLADSRIFFIIPWHASGANNHILTEMFRVLGADISSMVSTDYTDMQSEKDYLKEKKDGSMPKIEQSVRDIWNAHKNETDWKCGVKGGIDSTKETISDSQKHYRELRQAIFDGELINNKAWLREVQADEFLSQVYDRVQSGTIDNSMTQEDNNHIYPYEYWDTSKTYDEADINGERYIEYCRRLGFSPKFSGIHGKKEYKNTGNFTNDKGYWKLLVDRRMYDIHDKFQDLDPVTSEDYTNELVHPGNTNKEFVISEVADAKATNKIVDRVIDKETSRTGTMPTVDYTLSHQKAYDNYKKEFDVMMADKAYVKANDAVSQAQAKLDALVEEGATPSRIKNATEKLRKAQEALQQAKEAATSAEKEAQKSRFSLTDLTEEEQRIVDEAKANGTYLKAPNGKASNLNERQWIQVRTKAFKDWFGDWENDPESASKVVDENGEPMVVYHGTWKSRGENYDLWNPKNGAPFYTFNADSHFGTEEQAETIINSKRRRMEEYDNDYSGFSWTYPVFLNIRNIKEVYDANLKWNPIIKEAKGEGYDGLSYENEHEGHGMSYIAFEPTQIKSATENVGKFDASNPDIRYSLFGGNSGYVGYSMSKRAARAREEGRYPKTDFRKEYGVTAKSFEELVDAKIIVSGEWHHTSMYGNETKFYHWDKDFYADIYEENKAVIDKLSRERKTDEIVSLFENHPLAHKAEYDNETERLVDDVNREYNDKIREVENEKRDKEGAYNSAVFDALGQLTNVVKANNGNLWFNASNGVGIQIDRAGNEVSMNYGGANGSKGALRYEARNELQTAIEDVVKQNNIESADATYYTDKVNQLNAERAERVAQLVEAREKEYATEQTDIEGDYGGERYSLASDMARDKKMQSLLKNTPLWNDVAKTMSDADDYTIAEEVLNKLDEDAVNSAKEAIDNANGVFAKADATDVANRLERALQMMRSDENAEVSEGEGQQMRYSLRTKPEPKKTIKVYKLFNVDENGNPQALFIDAANSLEVGVWYDADSPTIKDLEGLETEWSYLLDNEGNVVDKKPLKRGKGGNFVGLPSKADVNKATQEGQRWMTVSTSKSGEKAYHTVGINGAGGVSTYALRPGWHATNVPSARHIGVGKDGANAKYRGANQRWFEIEISADVDYNEEARERYLKAHPTYSREKAYSDLKGDIPERIPEDGYYNFKTNSNANPNQDWYIAGAIKIVRPLTEEEGRKISRSKGIKEDLPYKDGVKNFDDSEVRYSLIGEQGATALDKAEEATHRMDNLAVARDMEAESKDAKAIRLATGWERGADGKWRYEIEDVKLKRVPLHKNENNQIVTTLGEIVDAEELFKAYPQLKELDVISLHGVNELGQYHGGKIYPFIGLNIKTFKPSTVESLNYRLLVEKEDIFSNEEEMIDFVNKWEEADDKAIENPEFYVLYDYTDSILIHEIQHAIQDFEGFAEGGRSDILGLDTYERLAGEVEARSVEKRRGMTPEQRRETLLSETEDVAREDQIFLMKNGDASRYSLQGAFYSNAHHAVEDIKQDKATPQQWIAMLKKNGGLKAGEDKWLGLEDWLNQQSGSVTKQDIIDYINANSIKIEEVEYSEDSKYEDIASEIRSMWDAIYDTAEEMAREQYEYEDDEIVDWNYISDNIVDILKSDYGEDILDHIEFDDEGSISVVGEQPIDGIRLQYTTKGLEGKREIALTIPTIDPYNKYDSIHFGDAGGGRAVAWIRFGETEDAEGNRVLVIDEIQSKRHQDGREKGYQEHLSDVEKARMTELKAYIRFGRASEARKVVDFLKSKGFLSNRKEEDDFYYNDAYLIHNGKFDEFVSKYGKKAAELFQTIENRYVAKSKELDELERRTKGVPSAPFEKNWQELAMKRMLRYATDFGFDKLAWTTGEQQAKRYGLGEFFDSIVSSDWGDRLGETDVKEVYGDGRAELQLLVDRNGVIVGDVNDQFNNRRLDEVVGKEIADKLLADGKVELSDIQLRLGGEGMKGFYDKMLPSFMNKYGKKWGVKVGEVTMPNLEEGYQTMHSVDVTDAMREDVRKGQPLFSLQGGRSIADKYEKRVNTKGKGGAMHLSKFNFMEAWQDEMRALKEVQRIIEQEYGIVLESYEDAYMAENAMSSIAKASWDKYIKEVYEPMMRIHDEWIRSGESNESINHYLIAKSGLERNRELMVRDALAEMNKMDAQIINGEYSGTVLRLANALRQGQISQDEYDAQVQEAKDKKAQALEDVKSVQQGRVDAYRAERDALREQLKNGDISYEEFNKLSDEVALKHAKAEEIADYSGLTALAKMHGSKDWQGFAEQMVRDFEAKHSNTDVMWEHINNNTKAAVDYSYKSGITSKQAKEYLDQMFVWYVPMKGNADVEAEDIYTYVNDKSSSFTPTVARAKGHTKYVSEDVMALIANTMQSAILQGERNKVKQKFLNMVENYPTDLFTLDRGWVVMQGNEWVESHPEIKADYTPEEIREAIEKHDAEMRELEEQGLAMSKEGALRLGVPFRATQNEQEHAISVMRNGEKMTIYVNGNPRVAQAINGKLKDTKESLGMRLWHTFTRWLSAGMTGYSIDFTGANLSRDTHHSSAIMFLKYGFKEQIRYILNGFADLPALIRGISGKSGNTKRDAYFQEFLANGGETGYANLRSLDDWKVENKKRIGRLKTMGGKAWGHTRNVLPYIAEAFGYINRLAETSSRFNAYVRARERNQDVATAISEAKNITVNFNKKGSAKTAGAFGFLANLYRETMMFANPVIQGLYQFLKVGKEHKGRFTVLCLGHVALGGVVPILNQMLFELLGGDDEDEYYNQSEYQRRTNLLIYTGHGYIKIPLAPIFRELYALGDVFYGVIQKKIKMEDGAKDVVGLVRSMFSIEGQSAIDDDWSLVRFILPEQLSVVADISDNVNFMGMPIYKDSDYLRFDPEYQKVYKNAWSPLVATSAKLNELLGGDEDSAPRNANDKWLNPAIWQHVISSIGGGPLKTIGDILDISDRAISGEDLSISNIPVAKRFFMKPDERTLINAVNREYYDIKEDMAWVEDRVRKFNRKEYSGYAGYAEKLDFMYHSPDYLKYAIFEEGNKEIEKLDKKIKEEVDEKEIENLKAMSATKKDQLISKVNAVDRITETDSKDPLLAHYIGKDVAYKMRKRLKQAQIADVDNPGALSEYTQTPEFEIDMEIAAYVNQIAQIDYYLNDDLMRLLTGQSRVQLEATKASLREALVELREAYEKRLKNKEEGEQ